MLFVIKCPQDRQKVLDYIGRLPERTLGWKIEVLAIRHSRSISQNRYAWYIFNLIATDTGETAQRVHDYFCQKFLTEETEIFGKTQKITKGTSALDTKQFENFMLNVRTSAQEELNIFCPLPGEIILE